MGTLNCPELREYSLTPKERAAARDNYVTLRDSRRTRRKVQNCPHCQKQFSTPPSIVWTHCSRKCCSEARSLHAASRRRIQCEQCGSEFHRARPAKIPRYGNFCSIKCRKESGRVPPDKRRCRVDYACKVCGRIKSAIPSQVRIRTFCSKKCRGISMRRRPSLPSHSSRGNGWGAIARGVRSRDKKCVICGRANKRRALNVDHIVPYHFLVDLEVPVNHPDNLAALCDSCHMRKTHYEKAILKGDLILFVRLMMRIGYTPERIDPALRRTGLLP